MDIKQLKIGVVGCGVVGRATARAYVEHVAEIRAYDIIPQKGYTSLSDTLRSDIVFVCLPTPQKSDSLECDTSAIERFLHELSGITGHNPNLVLRSTVPIGYTRSAAKRWDILTLVHSPEFLTARCSITDAHLPARNIVGVPFNQYPGDNSEQRCGNILAQLYKSRFPGVPVYRMTSDESEAVKLFTNATFAVKVSLFNELRALSDNLGLDWDRVSAGVLADGRISHSHTRVPGLDGKRGFGPDTPSACLPKDLASLVHCFHEVGLDPVLCEGTLLRNKDDRKKDVK